MSDKARRKGIQGVATGAMEDEMEEEKGVEGWSCS